ncbi:AAA family ATPase [Faecalibacter rhinopitheci]|uniref:DUF4357 domain-containing protein n=1 Tax=Faecalibacter rhinopitheci TaxID=2779678 RepID=A0A8J7KE20_9FLAO|nr:AAA family ATPase [Faecalibacter rhinopitheci]MBF0597991.1 DUF4357 domain-containing protein [Faecalibacter rhinopitheci]
MKITHLEIKDKEYKNLNIDLKDNKSGIMAFIGNNGSGKSNLLESLSFIFKNLYTKKDKDIPFSFSISYVNSGSTNTITITKQKTTIKYYVNDIVVSDVYDKLPKQIVAIYSGEENRLWNNWYKPIYLDYVSNITSGKSTGIGIYNDFPKMLYINKFYWHISLLCLLLQIKYDEKDTFCLDILNIQTVHTVKFTFNKDNYKNYADSNVKQFIQTLDGKDEYTLEELNDIFDEKGYTIADAYKYLYIAFTPDKKKMVEDIVIKYNDDHLDIEHFSEGEKKMLLIKAALEFAGAEDSLFILDEPDAHIHLNNKIQIKKVFERYIDNRQVVLTTHSPTLTDTLEEDALYMLNQGKLVPQKKQEILENVSGDFWNKFQQNAFIASRKPIILLVEGKHDKEHINNAYSALKDEYQNLDFEIFKLNTETNIQPFLRGLYESEFDNSKLYIGLFDRENKILNDFKNPKNYSKIDGKSYYKILESDKPNSNYFVSTLPEIEDKRCDCSIEMMYEYSLWENAFQEAVSNTFGKTSNKSIKEYSEDVLNDAKNILANQSSTFKKEDFNHFRKLFNIVKEIDVYRKSLITKNSVKDVQPITQNDEVVKDEPIKNHLFKIYTKKRNTDIIGTYNQQEGKFTLKKGSKLALDTVASYGKEQAKKRKTELKKKATFKEDYYILNEDVEFMSASGSINFATGGNMNGWDDWLITETNKSLQSIRNIAN